MLLTLVFNKLVRPNWSLPILAFYLNRKRQHSGGDEENGHLVPQAKRQTRAHPISPEPGRDAWDSEVQALTETCIKYVIQFI